MDSQSKSYQPQTSVGLVFAAGLLAGYVASMFLPENSTEEAREKFTKGAKQLKDTVTDPKTVGKVTSMFTSRGNPMELYLDARTRVMDELENTKETWEKINPEKYAKVLQKALDTMVEDQDIPEDQLDTLRKYLESDYKTFRSSQASNKKA